MTACDQDFTVYSGMDAAPVFTVTTCVNDENVPVDLSQVQQIGWDCQADLASTAAISKTKTAGNIEFVTDGTDGAFKVIIAAADTTTLSGFFMHEAWIKDASGILTQVSTGRLRIGRAPAWTYTGDPTSSQKDALRFTIGDTNYKDPQLYDTEILYALSQAGSVNAAAAVACRSIASKYSREVDSVQLELRTMWSSRAAAYAKRAIEFDVLVSKTSFGAPYAGGISMTEKRAAYADTDRVPSQFNIGMDDNYLPVGPARNEPSLRGQC